MFWGKVTYSTLKYHRKGKSHFHLLSSSLHWSHLSLNFMWSVTKFPHWNVRVPCLPHAQGRASCRHTEPWPQGAWPLRKELQAQGRLCKGSVLRVTHLTAWSRVAFSSLKMTFYISFYIPVLTPIEEQTSKLMHKRCSLNIRELTESEPQDFFSFRKIYCSLSFQITK